MGVGFLWACMSTCKYEMEKLQFWRFFKILDIHAVTVILNTLQIVMRELRVILF